MNVKYFVRVCLMFLVMGILLRGLDFCTGPIGYMLREEFGLSLDTVGRFYFATSCVASGILLVVGARFLRRICQESIEDLRIVSYCLAGYGLLMTVLTKLVWGQSLWNTRIVQYWIPMEPFLSFTRLFGNTYGLHDIAIWWYFPVVVGPILWERFLIRGTAASQPS